MFEKVIAEALGKEVVAVFPADQIDETAESPALLAREAGKGMLKEWDEEPVEVVEMSDGFVVTSKSHAIFMGHDGSFDLIDVPEPDDTETAEGAEETPAAEEEPATVEGLRAQIAGALENYEGRITKEVLQLLQALDQAEDLEQAQEAVRLLEGKFKIAAPKPPTPKASPSVGPGAGKGKGAKGGSTLSAPKPPMPKKPEDVGPGAKGGSASGSKLREGAGGKPKVPGKDATQKEVYAYLRFGFKDLKGARKAVKSLIKKGVPAAIVNDAMAELNARVDSDDASFELIEEAPMTRITFPTSRIQEFLKVAAKAEVSENVEVKLEGESYTVVLPEAQARPIQLFFKGDDVKTEKVELETA